MKAPVLTKDKLHADVVMARMRFLTLLLFALSPSLFAATKPNILFILADDLGAHDVGCYGSTYHKTPNIDALAARGMKLTQAYAANPLCSPTRSSILTGLYPARTGITAPACHLKEVILDKKLAAHGTGRALEAISLTRLKTEYITLADTLKDAGYRTTHFGKWHLGAEPYSPLQQGFESDWPHTSGPGPGGKTGYLSPWDFAKDYDQQPGEHIEDRMSAEAVKWMKAHRDEPFYLNYWAFSVHSPWIGKPGLVEKYRKSADPKNPQHNPVYAAMIESLDDAVGRLVRCVDELGIADHTIIFFFSDKMQTVFGMDCPPTSNAPLRGGKATIFEGGTREPALIVWPGVTKPATTSDLMLQSIDFYPTILEMLGQPKAAHKIDGTSFVPALKEGKATRDTIFCHFPHGPGNDARAGDAPSTSVRKGDLKLIRFYADNDDQSDRLVLYNLKDDIGEQHDIAAQMPDKVKELNAMITGFLKDTDAVVPIPNPAWTNPRVWSGSKESTVTVRDGIATAESKTGRPTLQLLRSPEGTGKFSVSFRMRITGKAPQSIFLWGTKKAGGFAPARRVVFTPETDGQWHEYTVKFETSDSLRQLRLDGSLAPSKVEVDWIRLSTGAGVPVQSWEF